MEVAALGLKIENISDVNRASGSLDDLAGSAERAQQGADGLAGASRQSTRRVREVGDASRRTTGSVDGLARAARLAAGALAAIGVGVGLSQSIREIADFQGAINGLSAVTGATIDQMDRLEQQARLLGATSRFSAQQAAEGQRFLAQAGFEVNEILESTPGILQLAAAGQLDLARAADIASNVLGGMRLEVDQLNRVNDVLAATASRSNTTIEQLGQALSFAAPFAAGAAMSIEEAAAAIGVMSDAGIQASRAGTGLVGVIRQLSNVTGTGEKVLSKYGLSVADVSIESRGLAPVLETLREAGLDTADSIALFGSEAGAAAQVLVQGYSGAIEGATGETERMAGILDQGLSPAFLSLSSAVSESVLQMGDSGLAGTLESLIRGTTGLVSIWNGMGDTWAESNDVSAETLQNMESLAEVIKVVSAGVGGATAAYITYTAATRGAMLAQLAFNTAAAANPYVLLATGIAAATAALWSMNSAQQSAISLWESAIESEEAYQAALSNTAAANRIQQIVQERMHVQGMLNNAQDKWIRDARVEEGLKLRLIELEEEYHAITDNRIAAEKARAERQREADEREARRREELAEAARIQQDAIQRASEFAVTAESQLADAFDQAASALHRQINLTQDATEYERLLYEIQYGRLAGLSGERRRELEDMARQVDLINERRRAEEQQAEINRDRDSIVRDLMTEEEKILDSYNRRRDIVLAATFENEQARTELLLRLENERNEALVQASGSYWDQWLLAAEENLTDFNDLAGSVIEQFSRQFGDAFESMIFDAETLGDAVRGMAEGMMRSVVNALGQMAAQWLAYQAVQMLVGKTAQSSAATVISANASAQSQLAGLNAFTSTAAIPIVGPALAPAAMAAAIAATAPLAASIAATASAGVAGFQRGGYTGSMGVSEVAGVVHGREYVFDAASTARIGVDNLEAMRSGRALPSPGAIPPPSGSARAAPSPVVVNLFEDSSRGGDVEQRQRDDGSTEVNVFVADIMSNGPRAKAMQRAYGLRRQGR